MSKSIESFTKLATFGRKLLQRPTLKEGLPFIASYAVELLEADRCSVFVYDESSHKLWTKLSHGVDRIEIDAGKGLAGATLREQKAFVVNDPYNDPYFLSDIDAQTGYTTRNILSLPIFDSAMNPIGVVQFLNKLNGNFDNDDLKLATFFKHYISSYIELTLRFGDDG